MSTARNIKNFTEEFTVKDSGIWLAKYDAFHNLLSDKMRQAGYVPVLDLYPLIRVEYDAAGDVFEYELTLHGVYVGKKKAWNIDGITEGREIPRHTPPSK